MLVSLWWGACFKSTQCKWQASSQILDLHSHHPIDEDHAWILTTFCTGFSCCPVGVSNLNFSLQYWSWSLTKQNPFEIFEENLKSHCPFLTECILAYGLLCFHPIFKFIGSYLYLPMSVRHHSFPFHCGEGLRKPILQLKLYIFIVILFTVDPALSSLLPFMPQGKTLALAVKSAK